MNPTRTLALASALALLAGLALRRPAITAQAEPAPEPAQAPSSAQIRNAAAVGHEFRQDDLPAIANSPDG